MEGKEEGRRVRLQNPVGLACQLQEEGFCRFCRDVVLRCCDGRAWAHRLVLASASPLLRRLLLQETEAEVSLLLPDTRVASVHQLLCFAYTGRLQAKVADARDFLQLVTQLGIDPRDVAMSWEQQPLAAADKVWSEEEEGGSREHATQTAPSGRRGRSTPDEEEPGWADGGSAGSSGGEEEEGSAAPPAEAVRRQSKRRIEVPVSCRAQDGSLQCDFCARVFQTARAWQDHRESHTSTQSFQCAICSKTYRTHRAWYQHTQYHKYRAASSGAASKAKQDEEEEHAAAPPALPAAAETPAEDGSADPSLPRRFHCRFCAKAFKAQRSLEEHELTHTSTQSLPCEICGKTYPSHRKLYFHLKSHVKSANYRHMGERIKGLLRALVGRARSERPKAPVELRCNSCSRTYKDARSFQDHMVKHTGRERVGCGVCGKQLGSYRALYQHLQHHRRSRPGEQSVISELASLRRMGKVGARRGRPRRAVLPSADSSECPPESLLEVQLTEESASEAVASSLPAPQPSPHKCVVCSRRLPSAEALSWHLTKHRPWVMLPCGLCGKPCSTEAVLKQHRLIVHSEARPFRCSLCPLAFKTEARLRGHEEHHNPVKTLRCPHCPKAFNCARNLRQHVNRQHGEAAAEARWACEACGKRFRMRECLTQHRKIHSGERPHQCERCGKRFIERGQLRQHLRVHTGEKPFQCEFCGRAFAQQSQLAAHRRTHTGERPFSCGLCGKAFGQLVILQDHQMRHTGQKRFQCSYCPKAFVSRTDFRGHVNLHTGEKPYQCRFCPMRFPAVSNRAHHERRHKDNHDPRLFA